MKSLESRIAAVERRIEAANPASREEIEAIFRSYADDLEEAARLRAKGVPSEAIPQLQAILALVVEA